MNDDDFDFATPDLDEAPGGFRTLPHSIEAEQAILGAILVNNEAYNRVADYLRPEHFYEPVHARLFEAIAKRVADGRLADPVTLKRLFDEDEALQEVDGGAYLARLARAAETIVNAEHYGKVLHDLALKRGLIEVGETAVNRAYDPMTDESGRQQLEEAERALFQLAQEGEVDGGFKEFPNVLTNTIKLVESAYHKQGKVTGVPTGLTGVDEKLGGLQPSDLVILAARPSMGKTALAVTMAANAAAARAYGVEAERLKHPNYTVAVFSLEMSAEQLAMRLLSSQSRIGSDDLRKGNIAEADWPRLVAASQALAQHPLYIDDTPALSVAAVRTRARRLMRRHGLSLIVVDYLQLLRGTSKQSQGNRVLEIGEITMTLKAIAKELNVPVLALSQLSRQVENREDKRPQLSDLRDSGTIEQDADVVMFLYREEYYLSRAQPQQRENEKPEDFTKRYQDWHRRLADMHNKAELIVAKQRNGPIGPVTLQFDANYGRFFNFDPDPRHQMEPL
ncbi:MAG: replicative DNA helicase [Geminicoccaceae bacterium]|nr:MAG: replicative DNA helicase [Geminicoccaceae bacterium]